MVEDLHEGGEKVERVHFFHICTDGTDNCVVHLSEDDFKRAVVISAICAFKTGVRILCFCHMSTHSHFVICCESLMQARSFIEAFKRDYSRYMRLAHDVSQVYRSVSASIKEISDIYYLRNCIAYVLLNPVVPGIVRAAEEYRWSSFDAYFNCSPVVGTDVRKLTARERRRIFMTHADLSGSGLRIDGEDNLVLRSFVEYRTVENLFRSKENFYKSLIYTNSPREEEIYVPHQVRYTDSEILAEAEILAKRRYGSTNLLSLTHSDKVSLLIPLQKKTGATASRLARVLRMDRDDVRRLLGGRKIDGR